jgi:hypothetical protein
MMNDFEAEFAAANEDMSTKRPLNGLENFTVKKPVAQNGFDMFSAPKSAMDEFEAEYAAASANVPAKRVLNGLDNFTITKPVTQNGGMSSLFDVPVRRIPSGDNPMINLDIAGSSVIEAIKNMAQSIKSVNDFDKQGFFGCFDFLNGNCDRDECRYVHKFIGIQEMEAKLRALSTTHLHQAMRDMADNDRLFKHYFQSFCSVLGEKGMVNQLKYAMAYVEKEKRSARNYRYIVDGLVMAGMSRDDVADFIIKRHTKRDFEAVDVVVETIFDTTSHITRFLENLFFFANIRDYYFKAPIVDRAIELSQTLAHMQFVLFTIDILNRMPMTLFAELSVDRLSDFLIFIKSLVEIDPSFAEPFAYLLKKFQEMYALVNGFV